MADQFTFDIPTFDFGAPAAPGGSTGAPAAPTDNTFSFDIPTFDATPAPAVPTFDFQINSDLSVPATTAPTIPSFSFDTPAAPASTIPTFEIPEIALPVEQKATAPITFEMPEILAPSTSEATNDWSVPFSIPEVAPTPAAAPVAAAPVFEIPTIPTPEVPKAVDMGIGGLPPLGGELPPLGGALPSLGGLPGLPPLGAQAGVGLPGLPPLGGATAGLPPLGNSIVAPLQGGNLSSLGSGSMGLPQLAPLGTPSLPKLAPKAAAPAKAAPPQESIFITDPSSFYLNKNWKVEGFPDPVKTALSYDLKGSGNKLSLTVILADGTSSPYEVSSDVTIQNLVLAIADKNKIWRHEVFSLLEGQFRWLNHSKTFADEGIRSGTTLAFRIKYWKNQYKLADNAVRHFMYLQTKEEIISGRWPCATPTAIRLAGHQLQVEIGNFSPAVHKPGFLRPKINQYLPPALLQKEDLDYVERRILYIYSRLLATTKDEMEDIYVSIAQGLQMYGATIFPAKKGDGNSFGVAEDGIFVPADANPKTFQFIQFPFLKAWKATDDGFQVEVGKPKEGTHKFTASKEVADAALHLLSAYFQLLEAIDKGNLPNIALPVKAHSIPSHTLFTPPRENLSRGTPVDLDAKITNRLIILRNAYRKVCEQAKVKPLEALIWQIDRALDEEVALDKIDLSFLGIGPQELGALAATLEAVFSYSPPPAQSAYFSENLAVSQFILNDNPIGLAGAIPLGRIIKVANFKEYYLKRIGLGEKGAQALKPYLEANSTLEKIDLEGNEIKNRGVSAVVKSLKSNTKTNCFIFTNNKCNEQVTLILSGLLTANNFIQELSINSNKIGDGGVGALLNGMERNSGLKNFDLGNTKFTSKTGVKLINWLESRSQMRSLVLSDNKLEDSTGKAIAKYLQSASGLMTLDISRTRIGAKSITEICQAIGGNKSLRNLFMNGNEFDKKGSGSIIVESLRSNDTLQKLGIGHCALGKNLIISLAGVIKASSKLKFLDLSGSPEFKDADVIRAWKDTLGAPSCILEEFICAESQLTVDGVKELSDALVNNKYLKKIDFSKNKLGKAGLLHVANALVANKNITEVTLKATDITPAIASEFVSALDGKNRTLKTVVVGENGKNTLPEWQALLHNANVHFQFQF